MQYGYAADLGDGRGITAGRAGFTSATGDLLMVVEAYTEAAPKNRLTPYPEELVDLGNGASDDTSGLDGFEEAWRELDEDPDLRGAQDLINELLYLEPSQAIADHLGLMLPLSRAVLYGSAIQHGLGYDADSLGAVYMLMRSLKSSGMP